MEITIKAEAKEIAALVVALQERRSCSHGSVIQTGCIDPKNLEPLVREVVVDPGLSDSTTLI